MMLRRSAALSAHRPSYAQLTLVSRAFLISGLLSVAALPGQAAEQTYFRYGLPQRAPVLSPEDPLAVSVSPATVSRFAGQPCAAQTIVTRASQPLSFSFQPIEGDPVALGLNLTLDGSVTGILSGAGRTVFQVKAIETTSSRSGLSNEVTVESAQPTLIYPSAQSVLEGSPIVAGVPSTNLPSPQFSFGSGAPAWLIIDQATGRISGTAGDVAATTTVGTMVRAASGGIVALANWTVVVEAASVSVNGLPATLSPSQTLASQATTNLAGPVTWSLQNAPAWLTINPSTGALSGAAAVGQPVSGAAVVAQRNDVRAESAPISIAIASPLSLSYPGSPYYFSTGRANTTNNPILTGGAGAKTFAIVGGTLPPGVQLDTSTGAITGSPSSETNASLTVRVTDTSGSAQTNIALRVQTVVTSDVCLSGSGTYVVPAFNKFTARIVGAGGGGGGLYPGTMLTYDGTSGGASSVTLGTKTISVPGGLGGKTTTTAALGASLATAFPTVDWTGGTTIESSRGQYGAQGVKTNSFPTASTGSGGSSAMAASAQPTLPIFGSGTYSSPSTVTAPGVGGSAGCYAPTSAQQGSYQGYQLWCGAGGSGGAFVSYRYNRTDPGSPNTGSSIAYATGSRGTATSPAGNASHGSVCFSVE